jgi:hypothetical protein
LPRSFKKEILPPYMPRSCHANVLSSFRGCCDGRERAASFSLGRAAAVSRQSQPGSQ